MQTLSQLVTSNSKLGTRNKLTSLEIRERALSIAGELASTEAPNDMTAWYCKAYRVIGEQRFTAVASMARDVTVKNPRKMFGWLLREEMKARTT